MKINLGSIVCLTALLSIAAVAGCDPERSDAAAQAEERGPIGKADAQAGSCATPEGNVCGASAADAVCWCDDQCEAFGDCCADKAAVCDGAQPACDALDPSIPEQEAACDARPDCELDLVPECPTCQGGTIVCIPSPTAEPASCESLDLETEQGRAECEARTECEIDLVPACPVCPGGTEQCVNVSPAACGDLNVEDPAGEAECQARPDCEVKLVPDCPTCQGGTLQCVPV